MADQSDEILSRLRGISSDEKSEMGKMKCRIDDQARLIMMLKKRNDEYILANMALDKHSIELENQIDGLREELEQQQNSKDKIDELTQTIEQLKSSNFQWELKDQQTNQKFSFHNQQYEKLQQNILSFQQQIQRLEQLLEESKQNSERLQNDFKQKLIQREKKIDNQTIEIQQIRDQLKNIEQKLQEKDEYIQQIQRDHLNDLDQSEKSKQSLQEQAKLLQKRLHEYSTNEEKLRQQLNKTQQLLNEANQRFINEEERVNCDVRVKQIQEKLIESQKKLGTLEQEFLAYKNYTASLLNKEKHLNERLQLLLNGRTT